MQFTEYDAINNGKLDRTKTWINTKYKQVFSAEIKYDKYYQIIKRYNPSTRCYSYFVAFMDNPDKDNHSCRVDELGRTRFSVSSIWNELFSNIKDDTNIILEYVETINNCDIFSLKA